MSEEHPPAGKMVVQTISAEIRRRRQAAGPAGLANTSETAFPDARVLGLGKKVKDVSDRDVLDMFLTTRERLYGYSNLIRAMQARRAIPAAETNLADARKYMKERAARADTLNPMVDSLEAQSVKDYEIALRKYRAAHIIESSDWAAIPADSPVADFHAWHSPRDRRRRIHAAEHLHAAAVFLVIQIRLYGACVTTSDETSYHVYALKPAHKFNAAMAALDQSARRCTVFGIIYLGEDGKPAYEGAVSPVTSTWRLDSALIGTPFVEASADNPTASPVNSLSDLYALVKTTPQQNVLPTLVEELHTEWLVQGRRPCRIESHHGWPLPTPIYTDSRIYNV